MYFPGESEEDALKALEDGSWEYDVNAQSLLIAPPLAHAARLGFARLVSSLIARGARVNFHNRLGKTALMSTRSGEVARILLQNGALVNAADNHGRTALMEAAWHGRAEVIPVLLEFGADLAARDHEGNSALSLAVRNRHPEIAETLAAAGAPVTFTDAVLMGDTSRVEGLLPAAGESLGEALRLAAGAGMVEMARLLLSYGADPNEGMSTGHSTGVTPLMIASEHQHRSVVDWLLAAGADPNRLDSRGQTALLRFLMGRRIPDLSVLKMLLDAGADPDLHGEGVDSPLVRSYFHRNLDSARLLLAAGANPDARGIRGSTGLHWAWDEESARLLIEHGANVHLTDEFDRTPLELAAQWWRPDVARVLVGAGVRVGMVEAALLGDRDRIKLLLPEGEDIDTSSESGMTALMGAAHNAHTELVRFLIGQGADLHRQDHLGATALNHAAGLYAIRGVWEQRIELIDLLLDRGAAIDAGGKWQTPVAIATRSSNVEMLLRLVERGANPDSEAWDGPSLLTWAVTRGEFSLVELLLQKGADPDGIDGMGSTPAALAVPTFPARRPPGASADEAARRKKKLAMLDLLLRYGAGLDVPDRRGRTPLMAAVRGRDPGAVVALLQRGANVNARTAAGTALIAAVRNGHIPMVQVLLQYGADVSQSDEDSKTPEEIAGEQGNTRILQLLKER